VAATKSAADDRNAKAIIPRWLLLVPLLPPLLVPVLVVLRP
jgi:hypothetical protein